MGAEWDFAELIRRVRTGDDDAAAELVRLYEPEIRREVRVRLRLRDSRLRRVFDSMDIVQSVLQSFFIRTAAGQYNLEDPKQLCALLAAMARTKLAEQVRHEQRHRRDIRRGGRELADGVGDLDDSPTASRVVSGRELLGEFRRRLTEEECQLTDLRAEGKTWAEVAEVLGGTAESRRKQFSRSVDRIAQELGLSDPGVLE